MTLLLTAIILCLLIGGIGLGIKFGMRIGREMAETRFIDHTNRHPLHYGFEITDTLYPARKPLMIEVPEADEVRLESKYRILKENFNFS